MLRVPFRANLAAKMLDVSIESLLKNISDKNSGQICLNFNCLIENQFLCLKCEGGNKGNNG